MAPAPHPPALWRAASALTLLTTAAVSRAFLYGAQRVSVHGRDGFLRLLDARRAAGARAPRGLLTVCNHQSVVDDPLMWGSLPLRYSAAPATMRHALGSADICFTAPVRSAYFALGQVHATHRLHKSPRGGLFQPAMRELVDLLAPAAAAAAAGPPAWVHVHPEGRVHQRPDAQMRYFKWGVSRLLLEPPVQPLFVPMFIDGFDAVMHESRGFPRFLPRVGKHVTVVYGEPVEGRFDDLRAAWRRLVEQEGRGKAVEESEVLKTGEEAVRLRIEATRRVREAVEALRRAQGYSPEDEAAGRPETYREMGKEEGKREDGSWEKDT